VTSGYIRSDTVEGRGMEIEGNMAREVRFGSLGIFVEGERPS